MLRGSLIVIEMMLDSAKSVIKLIYATWKRILTFPEQPPYFYGFKSNTLPKIQFVVWILPTGLTSGSAWIQNGYNRLQWMHRPVSKNLQHTSCDFAPPIHFVCFTNHNKRHTCNMCMSIKKRKKKQPCEHSAISSRLSFVKPDVATVCSQAT